VAPKSPILTAARTLVRPQLDPDYGMPGRSAWLDIDWPAVTSRTVAAGAEVSYVDLGSGPGEPIVFVHGLGASWQSWLETLPHFASTHRCVAMDLPGFGASPELEGEVTIRRYGEVVDALLQGLGIERAAVVGNSMGGFIAAELALRFPTAVSRLVLVSPAVLWQEYRRAKPILALAQASDAMLARALSDSSLVAGRPRLRAAVLAFGGFHLPHLLPRELQRELVLTSRRTPGFLPALQALASYPLRDELADVRVPTLLVWGTDDTLVGAEQADELERLIPGARKIVFAQTGHVAMLERPARFNDVMEEFLAEADVSRETEAAAADPDDPADAERRAAAAADAGPADDAPEDPAADGTPVDA
jgi:pimeloyl-ACP methyl ester carboxylesterase